MISSPSRRCLVDRSLTTTTAAVLWPACYLCLLFSSLVLFPCNPPCNFPGACESND
jgi:hypothetical protein